MEERRTMLVLGGARSGKSAHAELCCVRAGGKKTYIATAEALDSEMGERIQMHQERRGDDWQLVEEPIALLDVLEGNASAGQVILVDCVTVWLSNLMGRSMDLAQEVGRLADVLPTLAGTTVLVSNEVGLGIVPDNALARAFRDEAGLANQMLAEACDEVVFVAAGLPVTLKNAS